MNKLTINKTQKRGEKKRNWRQIKRFRAVK